MKRDLTKIQNSILEYISEVILSRQIPPTLLEIAKKFGYKNRSTVAQHLKSLEKKGYIVRKPRLSRSIELKISDKFLIPRPIVGEVAAGNPLQIYPDAIDTIELPIAIKIPKDSFLLKVKGNSLEDAYIFNGDVIIVNPNKIPENGKIVVAIIEDSAVVKRFYRDNGNIILKSENPNYEPIVINSDYDKFRMVGVVIGVYRSMGN